MTTIVMTNIFPGNGTSVAGIKLNDAKSLVGNRFLCLPFFTLHFSTSLHQNYMLAMNQFVTRSIDCIDVLLICLAISCKKYGLKKRSFASGENTVADMKEWWYGKFRKTAAFKEVDMNSPGH